MLNLVYTGQVSMLAPPPSPLPTGWRGGIAGQCIEHNRDRGQYAESDYDEIVQISLDQAV
jgi:hypothetical protein